MVVPPLLKDINKNSNFYRNIEITIITPVNPIGATYFSRFNGQGKDINRDFYLFETKEARIVSSVFKKVGPDFVVTCHEGPHDGTFLYVHKLINEEFSDKIISDLKEAGIRLATKNYFGFSLPKPGYSPLHGSASVFMKLWKNIFKMSAFGAYCTERGVPLITVEGPWKSNDMNERITVQLETIKSIVNLLTRS